MDASHASHKDDKKGKGLLSKGRYHEIETGLKKQCEPEQCKIMLDSGASHCRARQYPR